MENWIDLKGFEGTYQISDKLNFRSLDRIVLRPGLRGNMKVKGKELKPTLDSGGYLRIRLNGKFYSLHRLIALMFIPKSQNRDIVNHKDGNKLNNKVDNLEWCNYYENNIHSVKKENTSSGLTGVTLHKRTGSWMAQIHYKKKHINLGYYKNKEKAFEARCNFEKQNNIKNSYLL